MTPERLAKAATLLAKAATLLGDDPTAPSVSHLARSCRIRAQMLEATVRVEVPLQPPVRFTVRQDQEHGGVTLIDRDTGERREVALLDFAAAGSALAAWDMVG